jgi:hypothetical protein
VYIFPTMLLYFRNFYMVGIVFTIALTVFPVCSLCQQHCPCGPDFHSGTKSSPNSSQTTVCAIEKDIHEFLSEYLEVPFVLKSLQHSGDKERIEECALWVHRSSDNNYHTKSSLCPGVCFPSVHVSFPLTAWRDASLFQNIANITLSCSFTGDMFLKKHGLIERNNRSRDTITRLLLAELLWRRLYECTEKWRSWHELRLGHSAGSNRGAMRTISSSSRHGSRGSSNNMPLPPSALVRRKVYSLVVWIGSIHKPELMEAQSLVLDLMSTMGRNQTEKGEEGESDRLRVLGWGAAEDVYGCGNNNNNKMKKNKIDDDASTLCLAPGGNRRFKGLLPSSSMNLNGPGWRCAQQRPLRALAHVLSLFSPEVLVLLDDDTFLNYNLLQQQLGAFIKKDMREHPFVLGEFQGRSGDNGHLCKGGIFAGGSGYILGQKVLQLLVSHAIRDYGFELPLTLFGGEATRDAAVAVVTSASLEDEYRSDQQVICSFSITTPRG